MAHMIMAAVLVLATTGCVFGLAWEARGWRDERRAGQAAAERVFAGTGAPVPYTLAWTGWTESSGFAGWQGASDPAFEMPQADPLALAAAAYQLGQDRATADDTHREAEAIWAEVQANPQLWRYR